MGIVNKHHFQWLQEAQARLIDSFPEATTFAGLEAVNYKYSNQHTDSQVVRLSLCAFADRSSNLCTTIFHELTAENTDIGNSGRSAALRGLIQQLKDELNVNIANTTPADSVVTGPSSEPVVLPVAPALPEPAIEFCWPDGGH